MLRGDAGEALQSPLTATHGIFRAAPSMHEALVAEAPAGGAWRWAVDDVSRAAWHREPWGHSVLVTLQAAEAGDLDRVIHKARLTAARGHRVVLAVAGVEWQALRATGARKLLRLPAGSVPWGDATGWPDAPSARAASDGRPWATHSWRVDARGVPTASAGDDPAALRRHCAIMNATAVDVVLYGGYVEPTPTELAGLAWVLAGTGCRPHKQEVTCRGLGRAARRGGRYG